VAAVLACGAIGKCHGGYRSKSLIEALNQCEELFNFIRLPGKHCLAFETVITIIPDRKTP